MAYLLDTHTFLWLVFGDAHLSTRVAEVIRDPANEIVLSAVSPGRLRSSTGWAATT